MRTFQEALNSKILPSWSMTRASSPPTHVTYRESGNPHVAPTEIRPAGTTLRAPARAMGAPRQSPTSSRTLVRTEGSLRGWTILSAAEPDANFINTVRGSQVRQGCSSHGQSWERRCTCETISQSCTWH